MENTGDQHEAIGPSSSHSAKGHSSVAATHPLQEVAVHTDEVDEAMPQNKSKENWVKFDDEVNGISENKNDNFGGGNDRRGSKTISDAENATRSAKTATTITTTTETDKNRLSPLPAPPSKLKTSVNTNTSIARPRTPTESSKQQQQLHLETITAAPVQGLAVSSSSHIPEVAPAVLDTEITHVNLNAFGKSQHQQQQLQNSKAANVPATSGGLQHTQPSHQSNNGTSSNAIPKTTNITIPVESAPSMRTIELSTGRIREGFANGDVIVTLLPANTRWPWITPAIFRPELVPEELMAQGLTLTVEEYVHAMETLVNDYRFTVYNICYKRILVCWILFAFAVLLTLLFSGLQGVALFALGVGWLFLNAAAIFLCMWVKLRLSRGLEKCLARVNKQLMKHNILLILDDRGRISCHKVNLCFMYFDATQCVYFLNEFLEQTEQNGGEAIKAGWEAKLDIDMSDIVIQGTNSVRLSRRQERGLRVYLRYASRWGMEALRGLVDVTPLEPGRHCGQFQCPCQYIKQHLQCKPRGLCCLWCPECPCETLSECLVDCLISLCECNCADCECNCSD